MALYPRPVPPSDAEAPRSRWLHWIAWLFVAASVAVQLFLLSQVWDYRHDDPNCGERCAMAGMGIVALLTASVWVILPGLSAALWLLAVAVRRHRTSGGQLGRLLVLGCALALTAVLVTQVALADHKIARPAPVHAEPRMDSATQFRNDEVAGYSWASDGGITSEADCTTGSPAFREGCRKFARAHGDTTAGGRRQSATLRIQP
jgi:hypothetical protein